MSGFSFGSGIGAESFLEALHDGKAGWQKLGQTGAFSHGHVAAGIPAGRRAGLAARRKRGMPSPTSGTMPGATGQRRLRNLKLFSELPAWSEMFPRAFCARACNRETIGPGR